MPSQLNGGMVVPIGMQALGSVFQDLVTATPSQQGVIAQATSPFYGTGEFILCKAAGAVRNFGLVRVAASYVPASGRWEYWCEEVPNTANQGRTCGVAVGAIGNNQWGWVCIGGVTPVNSTASVGSNNTVGITAAGQVGAVSAGKQVLGAVVRQTSSATFVKSGIVANSGDTSLFVKNLDGWFVGVALSGTGIAVGTTITAIDWQNNIVTLSAATTAAVNTDVTGTYNDGTTFYNMLHINRPMLQGQIS